MRKLWIALFVTVFFMLFLAAAASIMFLSNSDFGFSKKIAIIPIKGEIVSDSTQFSEELSALEIVEKIGEAESDPHIAAILFEINSPGGGVVASRQIVEKINQSKKPTISWISEMGASGAYYAAASTNWIIADRDSITGSIGVISMIPNFEGLMEKIGVKMQILTEGKFKDIGSPFNEMTMEEKKIFQQILKQAFERFKNDIITFRGKKLDMAKFAEIADGRILTGEQAKEIGLIDEFGTKEYAIQKAAEMAGIIGKKPGIKDYSKEKSPLIDLFSSAGYSFGNGFKTGLTTTSQKIIKT